MRISGTARTLCLRTGWAFVGILTLVLVVFGIKRVFDTYSGVPHEGLFELRYLEHPLVTTLHMLSGIIFILLAPLQFWSKFRNKNLGLHRSLGKLLVLCALVSGVYGIVSVTVLPGFGGLASETAAWLFGPLFVFSILRAFQCARGKNIAEHREWMIRAFALGLGVGVQRLLIATFLVTTNYGFDQIFGPALWLGFSINLLVAEVWINVTRKQKHLA